MCPIFSTKELLKKGNIWKNKRVIYAFTDENQHVRISLEVYKQLFL